MTPPLAQIESAVKTAQEIAGHNDRVLFLATLILFFIAGGVAVKWFMAQLDKRDTEIARLHTEIGHVREAFSQYLISAAKEMNGVITRNSEAILANSKIISDSMELTERKLQVLTRLEDHLKSVEAKQVHNV